MTLFKNNRERVDDMLDDLDDDQLELVERLLGQMVGAGSRNAMKEALEDIRGKAEDGATTTDFQEMIEIFTEIETLANDATKKEGI